MVHAPFVFQVTAFGLGLLLGSFLNVCISRVPRGESVVRPRSHCPECLAPLAWYDNVPLLSWIVLRGLCRSCHRPISWRYPAVEVGLGLWFIWTVETFWRDVHPRAAVGGTALVLPQTGPLAAHLISAVGLAILGFLLLGLLVMDWQTQRLPDAFTWTGILTGFVLVCLRAVFLGPTEGEILLTRNHVQLTSPGGVVDRGNVFFTGPEALIGAWLAEVAASALLLLLVRWIYRRVRHREGLGMGDIKLLAMIAAFLGFWPAILSLFLGVLSGAGYAMLLLAQRRAVGTTRLPFGSFLAAGGLVTAMFGAKIISAYSELLR